MRLTVEFPDDLTARLAAYAEASGMDLATLPEFFARSGLAREAAVAGLRGMGFRLATHLEPVGEEIGEFEKESVA